MAVLGLGDWRRPVNWCRHAPARRRPSATTAPVRFELSTVVAINLLGRPNMIRRSAQVMVGIRLADGECSSFHRQHRGHEGQVGQVAYAACAATSA